MIAHTEQVTTGEKQGVGSPIWRNWSGLHEGRPIALLAPPDEEALRDVVRSAPHVRAVGAGHSFTPLVPTEGVIVSLDQLSGLVTYDADQCQATLRAGTRLFEVGPRLHDIGQAMPNMGDIDRQSLGGVLSTATHGTGVDLPCLAARVIGLRLITAQGDVLDIDADQNSALLQVATVSLGALGVVTQVRLQNVTPFRLHERVTVLPLDDVLRDLESWKHDHRHFELWAFPYSRQAIVKTLNVTDSPITRMQQSGDSADRLLKLCSESARIFPDLTSFLQSLVAHFVKRTERTDHSYRIFPSARNVRFHEMEYHVPEEKGAVALDEVCRTASRTGTAGFFPVEFRFVAGDQHWLSPFYGGARASIAVHQYHKQDYGPLFTAVEPIMRRYGGRPHWGKMHTLEHADLLELYPNLPHFLRIRNELDPQGKFLNAHLRSLFGLRAT